MRVLWFPMSNVHAPSARTRSHAVAAALRRRGVDVRLCGQPHWQRWPNRVAKFFDLARQLPFAQVLVFQKTAHATTHVALRLAQALGKRVVFDIDDAAHLWNEGLWVKRFLRDADVVVAGSHALLEVARACGATEPMWIPTGVEFARYPRHRVRRSADAFVIGWIGTPANVTALDVVREPLARLARERRVVLRIVTDLRQLHYTPPEGVQLETLPWQLEHAGAEVARFDVGIMPLDDDEAARCKCAFKALEFMACGVPALVSAVGENRWVVQHGVNGMHASDTTEWLEALRALAADPDLRARLGDEGRRTVIAKYTTERAADGWMRVLERVVAARSWREQPSPPEVRRSN